MVFHDAVESGEYDLVIGDEAWDVDYFLHENPELKRTAFAWMTDFVGWLPMPAGGEREAFLTADYNAEMIEHVERFPRIRDRAIFVGDPDDIVPDDFGPGLPRIRDWTERALRVQRLRDRVRPDAADRGPRGAPPRARATDAGRAGRHRHGRWIRRRRVAAPPGHRQLSRRRPAASTGLRMIAVAGPRIDPASLGAPPGVEVRAFVPDLYRHLAACDLAVVQGGLTTTMELAAARRPFLVLPAARPLRAEPPRRATGSTATARALHGLRDSPPEVIAEAIAEEIDRPVDYRPVETDGAARAAALIAPLI